MAECSVGQLEERVREEEEEVGRLRQERDNLREMNERSSAELRRALEVRRKRGEGARVKREREKKEELR